MKEVEVKARVVDPDTIKGKLARLGCIFSDPVHQTDRIYLHNSLEFPDITTETAVLRIRDSAGKYSMTLKKRLANELDKIEHEIVINDPEQAEKILKHIHFREVVRVVKDRQKCDYQGMEICLDEVDGLGTFIEVEKLTTEEDSLDIQKKLFMFLEKLGISRDTRVFKGYDTLIYERRNAKA